MVFRLHHFVQTIIAAAFLIIGIPQGHAHSGKARFHAIIDTDGVADDLRTLCMLLGNREVEVLAITTSEGALLPDSAAVRVRALLDSFYHEGVPVGAGRTVGAPVPAWRANSRKVNWGDTTVHSDRFPSAQALIAETLEKEEEKDVFVALGALTNPYDLLRENPALGERIERVIWYNSAAEPLAGANYETEARVSGSVRTLRCGCRSDHRFGDRPSRIERMARRCADQRTAQAFGDLRHDRRQDGNPGSRVFQHRGRRYSGYDVCRA